MSDNRLTTLIRWYEKEENQLKKQLKLSVDEQDFLAAHHNLLVLYRIQDTLEKHKILKAPLFIQKKTSNNRSISSGTYPKNLKGLKNTIKKEFAN